MGVNETRKRRQEHDEHKLLLLYFMLASTGGILLRTGDSELLVDVKVSVCGCMFLLRVVNEQREECGIFSVAVTYSLL